MELWCGDCKVSIILLGAFFINIEISINQLTSTSWKIGTNLSSIATVLQVSLSDAFPSKKVRLYLLTFTREYVDIMLH
jgi:hypothetical protein